MKEPPIPIASYVSTFWRHVARLNSTNLYVRHGEETFIVLVWMEGARCRMKEELNLNPCRGIQYAFRKDGTGSPISTEFCDEFHVPVSNSACLIKKKERKEDEERERDRPNVRVHIEGNWIVWKSKIYMSTV